MYYVYEEIRDEVENNKTQIRRVDFVLIRAGMQVAMMTCHVNFGFSMEDMMASYFGAVGSDDFRWYSDMRPKGQFVYISFLQSILKGEGYGGILIKMVLKKFKEGVIFNGRPYKISKFYGIIPRRDCVEKFYSRRKDLKSFYRSHGFKFKSDNFYLDMTKDCYESKSKNHSRTFRQRGSIDYSLRTLNLPQKNHISSRVGYKYQ